MQLNTSIIAAAVAMSSLAIAVPQVRGAEADGAKAGPAPLMVLFPAGSSRIGDGSRAVLDRASRAYNEGKPIVMILSGSSDRVGNPRVNLSLSQKRATAVLSALLDRGIPADRFQVLAKGQTEPPVPTKAGVPEARNRSVAISWR